MIFITIFKIQLHTPSGAAAKTPVTTCGFIPDGKNLYIREAGLEKSYKSDSFCQVALQLQIELHY
jgi:hypothetical protein